MQYPNRLCQSFTDFKPLNIKSASAGVACLAILLSGCADNTLRIDRAKAVAAAGKAATDAANDFLTRVVNARHDANIALVASDTSCAWGPTLVTSGSLRRPPAGSTRAPRCQPQGTTADKKFDDIAVDLRPLKDTGLRPTMDLIAALSSYLAAVNKIVDGKAPDISGQLTDAYGKAVAVQQELSAIGDLKIDVVPTLTSDQKSAVGNLITLITTLADEQHKADDLGKLAMSQTGTVVEMIASLKKQIDNWGTISLEGDTQLLDTVYTVLNTKMDEERPRFKDFEARKTLLNDIAAAQEAAAVMKAKPAVTSTVDKALDEISKAQQDLKQAYENPKWTDAEKKEAFKVNSDRLLSALQSIAGIVTAFAL